MKKEGLKTLLAGFFLIMLLLTVLSRAAAAVTVPRVMAEGPQRGTLNYRLYGQGTVVEEKTRAVAVLSGLRIEEIFVSEGQSVKKGDLLFSYTAESVRKSFEKGERELKKLLLSYKETAGVSASDTLQLENASLTLEQAEEALKQAKEKVKEEKRKLKEQAEEELSELLDEKECLYEDWEEKLWAAEDMRQERKVEYEKQSESKNQLEALLAGYQEAVEKADAQKKYTFRQELIKLYFGSDYEAYLYRKREAQRTIETAREALEEVSYSREAQRNLESAKDAYMLLTSEETKLTEAMNHYEALKEEQTLYELEANKLNIDETAIANAKTAWDRAENSLTRLEKKKEKELSEIEKKVVQAQEKVAAMEEGSYDYEKELQEARQVVMAAEYAVKQAKNGAGEIENSHQEAARVEKLRLEALQLDIQEMEEAQRELEELLEKDGQVAAELDGIVAELQLENGQTTSGQERCLLAVDVCTFQAKVPAEDCKHFQQGDEIILFRNQRKEELFITGLFAEDAEGMRLLTVDLPEGSEFSMGSTWSFTAQKSSGQYEQKLPIQAVREDNSGYYILVLEEQPGILNTETYVRKVSVELLDKDDNFAAVSGGIGTEERVVVSSSRNIEGGDQVRLEQ